MALSSKPRKKATPAVAKTRKKQSETEKSNRNVDKFELPPVFMSARGPLVCHDSEIDDIAEVAQDERIKKRQFQAKLSHFFKKDDSKKSKIVEEAPSKPQTLIMPDSSPPPPTITATTVKKTIEVDLDFFEDEDETETRNLAKYPALALH